MKLLVTGASGLVGSALCSFFESQNHEVFCLVRRPPVGNHEIFWNPLTQELAQDSLENLEGVVHLAGENIAQGRWSPPKKEKILQSRVQGTQLLAHSLARLKSPPQTLISASAMGYYGHRGSEIVDETHPAGSGFLAEVAQQWEAATQPAEQAALRVVHLRLGMVLSRQGGALPKILFPFQAGLGGPLGNGEHYLSWIMLEDVIGAIDHVLKNPTLQGAINASTPHPVTNLEFTKTLGRVLHRPTFLKTPTWLIRLLLGEMGQELLLASIRLHPKRLLESGYSFQYARLEDALQHLISNPSRKKHGTPVSH